MAKKKETKIPLKVVIDREKKKVVFAEASSTLVDIVFSFLTLPMGTIVRLLAKHSHQSHVPANIEAFSNLYGSVAKLNSKHFKKERCKDMLLNAWNSAEQECRNLKIKIDDTEPIKYFICEGECFEKNIYRDMPAYITTDSTVKCKTCGELLKEEVDRNAGTSQGDEGVFVTETSSFIISDDLHVIPNNPTSTLKILDSSEIENFAALEEDTLKLGADEFIHLLQLSFSSETPLSDLFFGTKTMNSQVPSMESPIATRGDDSSKKMNIKIYVQKSTNRIFLAHCSEDFIDFLLSLLTIPLGKVIRLLNNNHQSIFCFENVHKSVLELNVDEYLRSQKVKEKLLNPKLSEYYLGSSHIFPLEGNPICNKYLSDLDSDIFKELTDASPKLEGFVRGPTKYMVTDDLFVSPFSSVSCFTHLQSLKVPISDIEEQVISIGMEEALKLLRASLTSTSVLSNGLKLFILKNAKQETSVNLPKYDRTLKKPKVDK
ncbi:hypothetical protein POM88_036805 [Heracleum sosnowskyi]|uniref:DUF674 family protein n=1 Tax=Heracleum sosnowskyi TaxID=360622 RepID=A0AAD8MG21_9APIA|nr:hypothetical protein POM88_036805 [Heracleum sosnowskyi]